MPDYYFDIETYSKTQNPDIKNDEIIAITYQQIDSRTGEIKGKLNILKSWESSEKDILQRFHPIYNPTEKWQFIPIGCNLSFDFSSLIFRLRNAGIDVNVRNFFTEHPYIDIQPILIMFNRGSFKGAGLDKFTRKQHSGSSIKEWYENGDYQAIDNYIENEAESFLTLYRFLIKKLPGLWREFAEEYNLPLD